MSRLWYVAIAIATAVGGVTVIRLWAKPQVVYVPVLVPSPSAAPVHPPVHHKRFEDQFQPSFPPPDGGRYSK